MNYNSQKSTTLTLAITCTFCILLGALMIVAYPFLLWYLGEGRMVDILFLLCVFYVCCPAAWIALSRIIKLLMNIMKGEIFVFENVRSMRILSWCCAFVSAVGFVAGLMSLPFFHLVSGLLYLTFFIVSLGAAFMMLILRVLKNIMAKATEIKNENELTI